MSFASGWTDWWLRMHGMHAFLTSLALQLTKPLNESVVAITSYVLEPTQQLVTV